MTNSRQEAGRKEVCGFQSLMLQVQISWVTGRQLSFNFHYRMIDVRHNGWPISLSTIKSRGGILALFKNVLTWKILRNDHILQGEKPVFLNFVIYLRSNIHKGHCKMLGIIMFGKRWHKELFMWRNYHTRVIIWWKCLYTP